MARRKEDTAERLLQWSVEMGFKNDLGTPVTADSLRKICRGNMANIWEYVIGHVHDQQVVHEVKGNIGLQQLQQGTAGKVRYKKGDKQTDQREKLMAKRRELRAKLETAKRDESHLRKDIRRMKEDMSKADAQYIESMTRMQQLDHRNSLQQAYLDRSKVTVATVDEFRNRLRTKHQQCTDLANKSSQSSQEMVFFSKERVDSAGNQSDILETACTKQVRELCQQIQAHLMDMLQNKTTDKEAIKENKIQLWGQVEGTMRNHPADEIVKSLTRITEEAATRLRQRTDQINIKQDIADLKFKYESGQGFVDVSPGKGALKSVQELILEKQLVHIQRYTDGKKNRLLTAKLNEELHHLVAKVDKKLAERYANKAEELELAKTLLRAELNLASAKVALKVLRQQQGEQESLIKTSREEKELLFAKYRQIQDYQKVKDRNQSLIQALIGENLSSRKALDDTRKKIQHYTQQTVCEHESGTVAMATGLKDSAASEIKAFDDLTLDLLEATTLPSGELRTTNQLSISRFKTTSPALGGEAITQIQASLRFPSYQAPEKLLGHVIKMKCSLSTNQGLLGVMEYLQAMTSSPRMEDSDIVQRIKGLCEHVAAKDDAQTKQLCPVLQSSLNKGAETINIAHKTKSDLTAWWDQPVQHVTPWVTADDLSFSQWVDKWMMAVYQFKELVGNHQD